jgi:hypothetical protein
MTTRISPAARAQLVTDGIRRRGPGGPRRPAFVTWMADHTGDYPLVAAFMAKLSPSRKRHLGKWNKALEATRDSALINQFSTAVEAWAAE